MVMQLSAKKNARCLRAPRDFLPRLRIAVSCPVGLPWNSLPPPPHPLCRVYGRTGVRWRQNQKFLSDLLTHGAPMAHFARWSPLWWKQFYLFYLTVYMSLQGVRIIIEMCYETVLLVIKYAFMLVSLCYQLILTIAISHFTNFLYRGPTEQKNRASQG